MTKRRPLEGKVITGTTVMRAVAWVAIVALVVSTSVTVATALQGGESLGAAMRSAVTDEPLIWLGLMPAAWLLLSPVLFAVADPKNPLDADAGATASDVEG